MRKMMPIRIVGKYVWSVWKLWRGVWNYSTLPFHTFHTFPHFVARRQFVHFISFQTITVCGSFLARHLAYIRRKHCVLQQKVPRLNDYYILTKSKLKLVGKK